MNTKALRQKILDLAIHGKLVPQDPNDEPASVLLERIRDEKERLIKEGKIKRPKKAKATSDKPHYENVPFEVPSSWVWTTVGDIAESNIGLTYKPSDICDDGVPVYRSNNIQNRRIDKTELVRVNAKILDKQYLAVGDLLICARNGSRRLVGKCALIENLSEPSAFGAFMAVCRSAYNPWIYLLLNTGYFNRYLDDSNSTAINQVTQSMLLAFRVPFPPKKEQDRIIYEISKWFDLIDTIEKSKEELQVIISTTKSKILDLAIHGKLVPQDPTDEPASELLKSINPKAEITSDNGHYQKLPEGWAVCCLENVAKVLDNLRKPINSNERNSRIANKHENELFPYYGATGQVGFIDDYLVDGTFLLLGEDGAPFLDKYAIKSYPIKGKCWVNNHAHILDPQCDFDYLMYYLNHVDYKDYVNGSTRLKLTQSDMRSIIILLPPLTEQKRISVKVKYLFRLLDSIACNL